MRGPLDPLSTELAASVPGLSRGVNAKEGYTGLPGALQGYRGEKEIDGDPTVTCQIPFSSSQSGFKISCNEEEVRVNLCP